MKVFTDHNKEWVTFFTANEKDFGLFYRGGYVIY